MSAGKIDIALFQFNPGLYHNQAYLPYSAGIVWAYARTFPEIAQGYENVGFYFLREDPDDLAERIQNVDVAAFSTYLWNWEISNAVARALKRRFPNVLTIFGGPQVPNDARTFLATHPHVDMAVHGEGEETLADVLRCRLDGRSYASIPGLSFIDAEGFQCKQVVRDPIADLNALPSPYLSGVFDELFDSPIQFQATWETNRGCPYKCTFCYWGTDYEFVQRLRQFSMDRLLAEADYFGAHRIGHIYLADANFGILKRDLELAERLVRVKAERNGYPAKFKANYAKNSTDRVTEIARLVNKANMDRGVNLAIQSTDETTLLNIKRKNMRLESFSRFMHQYQREGIPTYVELILGMPGETYESFRDGISQLLDSGAHDALFLHKGVVLPNTEMDGADYRSLHGISTLRVPATLSHSSTRPGDVREFEELIVGTKTMPHEKWRASYLFAWATLTCHILRLTQVPALYASAVEGLSFGAFYEKLIDFARRRPDTLIGEELSRTEAVLAAALEGAGFDVVLEEFSDIVWPPEEASFLRICLELDRFYSEFADFLRGLAAQHDWKMDEIRLTDILLYQRAIVVKWDRDGSEKLELRHAVHSFYREHLEGRGNGLRHGRFLVTVEDDLRYAGDMERFSREIAFWGRRGGRMTYKHVAERELEEPFATVGVPA
jgi:radical SAM superfamily enzyme YgiQ (UPF0313 family)